MQSYRITVIFNIVFVIHAHTCDCLVEHNFNPHLFHYLALQMLEKQQEASQADYVLGPRKCCPWGQLILFALSLCKFGTRGRMQRQTAISRVTLSQ